MAKQNAPSALVNAALRRAWEAAKPHTKRAWEWLLEGAGAGGGLAAVQAASRSSVIPLRHPLGPQSLGLRHVTVQKMHHGERDLVVSRVKHGQIRRSVPPRSPQGRADGVPVKNACVRSCRPPPPWPVIAPYFRRRSKRRCGVRSSRSWESTGNPAAASARAIMEQRLLGKGCRMVSGS
jgi:hypothetical protein